MHNLEKTKLIPDGVEHVFSDNTSDEREKRQIAMMRIAATDVVVHNGSFSRISLSFHISKHVEKKFVK